MRRRLGTPWLAACMASLLAVAAPAIADDSDDTQPGVGWEQLSPEQQKVLGQFRGRWERLPPGQQQSLLRGAERWESMTPEQRERVKQRTERWQNMSPEEQQRARERRERFKQLPPEEQARLREEFRRYRDLPPEQREKARKQRQQAESGDAKDDDRGGDDRGRGRDRWRPSCVRFILFAACCAVSACGSLPDGTRWGASATLAPGWQHVGESARDGRAEPVGLGTAGGRGRVAGRFVGRGRLRVGARRDPGLRFRRTVRRTGVTA